MRFFVFSLVPQKLYPGLSRLEVLTQWGFLLLSPIPLPACPKKGEKTVQYSIYCIHLE